MTTTRRAAAHLLVLVGAVCAVVALSSSTQVAALTGNEFTVEALTTTEVDQPGIPGNDPASSQGSSFVGAPTPANCELSPSCMVVPFTIEVPEYEAGDDFFVSFEFSWDAPSGLEDLDFWIFDDGQMAAEEGRDAYTELGSAASADIPETMSLYEPILGRYNIVANNFSGANTSWHIKAVSTVGEFERPIESLAPPKSTTTTTRPTTTTTAGASAQTTTTVTVPEGVIIPDDDFDGGAFAPEQNDFQAQLEDQLAAVEDIQELGATSDESPSAFTVLAWMILLPAALAAGVYFAVRARRSRRRAASAPAA